MGRCIMVKSFIIWRLNYIVNGLKYRYISLFDWKFWALLLPENIKNKVQILHKKKNREIYNILKKYFYKNNAFLFNLKNRNEELEIKFSEPLSDAQKYNFVGEFFDLVYPHLIQKQKNILKNTMDDVKKHNSELMSWERHKTKFHGVYYYPVAKQKYFSLEGAYFDDNFSLKENEIVYDVGAHIGIFSIISAKIVGAKGLVYAFEPSKEYNDYIMKNAKLNNLNNIVIINKGLGDKNIKGGLKGMNFISNPNGKLSIATLDVIYASEKIKKPNFIKMDIEGFERNALLGGMKLLKKSKPKLSICTYHLKDDHEVLKKIIKKIDKNYKITPNEYNKKYLAKIERG